MNNEFNEEVCPVCEDTNCECNKEPKVAVKRKIFLNLEDELSNNDNCCCDEFCDETCECDCHNDYDENKKKSLAILGATVVAVGVAGGILYLVKNKK